MATNKRKVKYAPIKIIKTDPPKHFPKFGKLPGKPSDLIRLAIDDLVATERQKKKFAINMDVWSEKTGVQCAVCLAGCVIAQTVVGPDKFLTKVANSSGVDIFGDARTPVSPDDFAAEEEALYALDCFRTGDIDSAFDQLRLDVPEDFQTALNIVAYEENPTQFKFQMRSLADALEAEGY